MRDAALVASTVAAQTGQKVQAGITTNELDLYAANLIEKLKAKPANLNYQPGWAKSAYPAVLCTSVNNEIAHGIPDDYVLKDGDIITIDLTILFNGVYGDCAITLPVGNVEEKHEKLIKAAKNSVYIAIEKIKHGAFITDIAQAVENYALSGGYFTSKVFSGHGIGEAMHEEPAIPFFYDETLEFKNRFTGKTLTAGQVVCIEPILTFSTRGGILQPDGWTVTTQDGKFAAMFEHMVLVTEDGHEILTDHFTNA